MLAANFSIILYFGNRDIKRDYFTLRDESVLEHVSPSSMLLLNLLNLLLSLLSR